MDLYVETGDTEVFQDLSADDLKISKSRDQDKIEPDRKKPVKSFFESLPAIPLLGTSSSGSSITEDYTASGLKKKKGRKEKLTPLTLWGGNALALATWFVDWPIHLPVVAIPLISVGLILLVMSLTKLRKSQRRNKFLCYLWLITGVLLLLLVILI